MDRATPSPDDTDDLLLSCRYGDSDDVKSFIDRFGTTPVGEARDENGNNVLHMASANGHIELLDMLLPVVPSSLLSTSNRAGSTALHWAALNAQLAAVRRLVEFPGGPGIDLIDIKNAAGRSPLAEAEAAGWDEGAKWMVGVMRLVDAGGVRAVAEEEEEPADSQIEDQDQEDTDGGAARISVEGPGVGGRPPSSS
ncbi:cytoplasmic protein [Russula emetica]|nr:cytoplasmic protein [Russula emetica]